MLAKAKSALGISPSSTKSYMACSLKPLAIWCHEPPVFSSWKSSTISFYSPGLNVLINCTISCSGLIWFPLSSSMSSWDTYRTSCWPQFAAKSALSCRADKGVFVGLFVRMRCIISWSYSSFAVIFSSSYSWSCFSRFKSLLMHFWCSRSLSSCVILSISCLLWSRAFYSLCFLSVSLSSVFLCSFFIASICF